MNVTLTISSPDSLDEDERKRIEAEHGTLEDCEFVVYWRKYTDDEYNGFIWDGWPFKGLGLRMVRVDDPNNWKSTWFLFLH